MTSEATETVESHKAEDHQNQLLARTFLKAQKQLKLSQVSWCIRDRIFSLASDSSFFFFASVLYLYLATATLHWIPNRWTPRTVEYFSVEDVSIFVEVRIGPFKMKANDLNS